MICSSDQISGGTDFRGGPGGQFGGRGRFQDMDEPTLMKVAETTGGKYFKAEDAESLGDVLRDLPSQVTLQRKKTEVTSWFVLAGAVLVLLAVGLSQWWNRTRLPAAARPVQQRRTAAGP
jgi:Ca-activated chloride channel family protein